MSVRRKLNQVDKDDNALFLFDIVLQYLSKSVNYAVKGGNFQGVT